MATDRQGQPGPYGFRGLYRDLLTDDGTCKGLTEIAPALQEFALVPANNRS